MSKHRSFTPEFKAQVVLEILSGAKTTAEVCREHELSA
jgi:transposase-like protein